MPRKASTKARRPKKNMRPKGGSKKKRGSASTSSVVSKSVAKILTSLGGALRSRASAAAGTAIKSYFGLGAYKIRSNALLNKAPMWNPPKHNGFVFRNREMLGDVVSSSTIGQFQNKSFPLNPGMEETFPVLSGIAANFQEYCWEGVIFEYRTMSGNALTSTNTALGQVIMASNYNAGAAPFTSKAEMENSSYADSQVPSQSFIHPIECAPAETAISTVRFVRTGALGANEDIRLYDWSTFQIATNGLQAASVNCGELWVQYQVELMKIVVTEALGYTLGYFHAYALSTGNPIDALGNGGVIEVRDTLGVAIDQSTRQIVISPSTIQQLFLVDLSWSGVSAAALAYPSISTSTNVQQFINYTGNGAMNLFTPPTGATGAAMRMVFAVLLIPNGLNHTITLSNTGNYPTGTAGRIDMIITQIPLGSPTGTSTATV